MGEFENENERELADIERRRAIQKEVAMMEFERAPFAAIEQFFVAMSANGYTEKEAASRCREMVTDAVISFRREARVKARREGLRVVDAVPPGDRRPRRGRRPPPSSPHLVQS
jgi:hypothetical protein